MFMNREKIVAIILGAFLGIGLGFYLLFGRNLINTSEKEDVDRQIFKTEETTVTPQQQAVSEKAEIVVKDIKEGRVISSSDKYPLRVQIPVDGLVVVRYPLGEKAFFQKKGEFEMDLELKAVENRVKIVLYTMNSTFSVLHKEFDIYYFPEDL